MAHRQESGRSRRVACAKRRVLIERLQTAALTDRILRRYTTPNILKYMPRFSILDLAPVRTGGTIAEAYRNTVNLAQHADRWGFTRFWLAEHHNMPGIASAATSVLIGHVASKTSTIRVGSGGVMLPNHSPLVIAEQLIADRRFVFALKKDLEEHRMRHGHTLAIIQEDRPSA